jgi:hypothetical protein
MDELQRLRDGQKISNDEFIDGLGREKYELRDVLGEIRNSEEPTDIIKSRASPLLHSHRGDKGAGERSARAS